MEDRKTAKVTLKGPIAYIKDDESSSSSNSSEETSDGSKNINKRTLFDKHAEFCAKSIFQNYYYPFCVLVVLRVVILISFY